ncbi:type II restriction-modification enzyme [Campylobacter hyointestinalis]|uniref:restriction endonuclease subunit S n=1 Tax=Campylobacter hyointestinalis TaxID=198 RepID=UPI00072B0EB1|nr:restriction endonuclease subunit S [Campylobacter hyointestinalis]CUU73759.1 type II restriction-modification enzyme [Campylobacter hyointestinalis]
MEFKDLNRWDVAYNQNTKINNTTYKYDIEELNNICYINPKINLKNLIKEDKSVSFLSMDSVENDGKTFYPKLKKANENKGFMKFQNNDLLWAKITPCMQNKKSLIVNNLENGYGFGSTEFFVLRPKDLSEVDMKFILEFLRTDYVIEKAKETFKGSAGQQRVPKEFLEDLQIPLPPLNIQKEIVNFVENKKRAIKENQIKIIDLTKEINNTIDKIFIS